MSPIISSRIRDSEVKTADIADSNVTTAKIAASAVTSAKMDDMLLRNVSATLTNAQILAMDTADHDILAAPGAGYVHIADSAMVFYDYGGTQYTLTTDNVILGYSGSTDIAALMANASIVAAADYLGVVRPAVAVSVPVANKALAVGTSGSNAFGGGHADSTLTVSVWYRTVSSTTLV